MLAVIDLDVSFSLVNDIDGFDYHLYRHKSIPLNCDISSEQFIEHVSTQLNKIISRCHLAASLVHLIVLEETNQANTHLNSHVSHQRYEHDLISEKLLQHVTNQSFSGVTTSTDLNNALIHAQLLCSPDSESNSFKSSTAVLILSANMFQLDGVSTLLVCDQDQQQSNLDSQIAHCHTYATINNSSIYNSTANEIFDDGLKEKNKEEKAKSQHISQFLVANDLAIENIETIITNQKDSLSKPNDWLTAYENYQVVNPNGSPFNAFELTKVNKFPSQRSSTLITSMNVVQEVSPNFDCMLSLVASILCLDQRYRLGSQFELVDADNITDQSRWEKSPYYCLSKSTSYLPTDNEDLRHSIVSHKTDISHQLFWVSEFVSNQQNDDSQSSSDNVNAEVQISNSFNENVTKKEDVTNGFLALQPLKPIVINAVTTGALLSLLKEKLDEVTLLNNKATNFYDFCKHEYQGSQLTKNKLSQTPHYSLVLLASSFETLAIQINLALSGLPIFIEQKKPWKTPVGSYFSGQLINEFGSDGNSSSVKYSDNHKLSFVYPGIGSLYVGMGQDLLRLFPECYPYIKTISDNLAISLQDTLITPRLVSKPDFKHLAVLEERLRTELANIAEAGVSYACLLTAIFQKQLGLTASSAAGYSMGEVSMFAALDCWKTPATLSHKVRASSIFSEALSGPLMRLQSAWGLTESELLPSKEPQTRRWESFHIKADVVQVEAMLPQFPRVYITIINTLDSLVIAGDPVQCEALAKQLGVRAIALNVQNIIHCPLAKSEYENMLTLYSLPVNQKGKCQLFSTSCYLPVPVTEKAIAVSISKCLTEQVDFPRVVNALAAAGETVFIEMGAGKSLGTWIDRILKNTPQQITCLSANQKNSDDYSAIIKTIAPLISLGYQINCQSFFSGSLIRPVKKGLS